MARKIKEKKNMAPSALLREDDDSSDDDNQRKRDENNRPVKIKRGNYRMREQRALRSLKELKAENKMLQEKQQFLLNELRFLRYLFVEKVAEISQIDPQTKMI